MARMKLTIRLEGYERLVAELPNVGVRAYKAVDEVLGEWAVALWAYLKQNHPWETRTGRLMKSHYYQKNSGDWTTMEPIEWEIGADTRLKGSAKNYAMFLEFGWLHYKTGKFLIFPWFRPAYEKFKMEIWKQVYQSVLRKAAVKGTWT